MSNGSLNITSPAVTTLQSMGIPNIPMSNLEGIQYFTGLKELDITGPAITTLPNVPASISAQVGEWDLD